MVSFVLWCCRESYHRHVWAWYAGRFAGNHLARSSADASGNGRVRPGFLRIVRTILAVLFVLYLAGCAVHRPVIEGDDVVLSEYCEIQVFKARIKCERRF